jgi:ubiquinone/menaquinone biosynthesis C-methylase UbiE/uncharacterized protein YbaR (Trm112 family)
MDKLKILNRIKELYSKGENIIQYLKSIENSSSNSLEDILISYDFQAGSYIEIIKKQPEKFISYHVAIANYIKKLGKFNSILEVGVGEATTLANVIDNLDYAPEFIYGFDISWSRIKYGNHHLKERKIKNAILTTGDFFSSPFLSNSVDIVYTSHSLEPNGGKEKEALEELYRITNNYLVLLEPSYENASDEGKLRMEKNGYVRNLYATAKSLGYEIVENRLFDTYVNPLNPTGLIVIKKNQAVSGLRNHLACPISKTSLKKHNSSYFSEESLLAYPIIENIPCLLPQNAVIATHFLDIL